jgi:hypothetical protein
MLSAGAAGESVVGWEQGVAGFAVCHRHQGEWSDSDPFGFESHFATAHLLRPPGHFGFLYGEFVLRFPPQSPSFRLLFSSLEGGKLGEPAAIAEKGRFEERMALRRATNGDAVLAFFARGAGSLGREGPLELHVAAMTAGEAKWDPPVSLATYAPAKTTPKTGFAMLSAIERLWAIDVWAESAAQLSVVYDLSPPDYNSHVYVATWTKGRNATVHRLEGWPVRSAPRNERILRVVGLPDGSLIVLYAAVGSFLEVAHWQNGEVLGTRQEQLPGTILDMDIDPEGGLHLVGTSEDAFWYTRGTPGWIGKEATGSGRRDTASTN